MTDETQSGSEGGRLPLTQVHVDEYTGNSSLFSVHSFLSADATRAVRVNQNSKAVEKLYELNPITTQQTVVQVCSSLETLPRTGRTGN